MTNTPNFTPIPVELWIAHAYHHNVPWVTAFERNFLAQKGHEALKTEVYNTQFSLLLYAIDWFKCPEGAAYWAEIAYSNDPTAAHKLF
jgi:hypothetical protein